MIFNVDYFYMSAVLEACIFLYEAEKILTINLFFWDDEAASTQSTICQCRIIANYELTTR